MAPKKSKKTSEKKKEEKKKEETPAEEAPEEDVSDAEEQEVSEEVEESKEAEEEEKAKKDEVDEKDEETIEENGVNESSDEKKETGTKKSKKNSKSKKKATKETKETVEENDGGTSESEEPSAKKSKKSSKSKKKETAEENDGETSGGEEPSGLYDGPAEIFEEKRERKSRDFFTFKEDNEGKKIEDEPDYSKGEGTKLKDIPYIKYQISGEDDEDLLVLYKLMYRKQPRYLTDVKKKIYAFAGYPFDDTSKYYKSHQVLCDRLFKAGVRYINELLGLERKGKTKEEMISDLFEFLLNPKDLGLEVPKKVAAPKKKSTPRGKRKSKRVIEKGSKKIYVDASDSEEDEEEQSEDEEEEEEKEEEDDGRRRSRRSPNKNASAKSKASKRRKSYPSDDSSDDEVLVKVKKGKKSPAASKNPPTNPELKKCISSLLKDADLGTLTMKNILHDVYDKYSDFDLSSKKDYLKKTVKELL